MAYNPNNPNGQATSANSAPVVIASDQSAVPVTAASLPLPAGAATAANQTTANASLSSIDTKLTSPLTSTLHTAAKGTAAAGDVTSSTASANRQPLDVSNYDPITGNANGWRPDSAPYFASEPSTLLFDNFESLDTTNTWTTSGSFAPTASGGLLSFPTTTAALSTSVLRSQNSFGLPASLFLRSGMLVSLLSSAETGSKAFFGLGIPAGSPTVAVPLTNGVVFETDDTTGALVGVVYSNSVRGTPVSLTRPTDGNLHRYAIFYRSSRVYFEIDGVASAATSISFPNPAISKLPAVIGLVNGASIVGAQRTFACSLMSIADTARNNVQLSDGTLPWRKAAISSAGALSTSNTQLPAALGQTTMSASLPVAFASDQSVLSIMASDLAVTGQSAQTATVNNILTATAGAAATDLLGYKSALVQIISTGTGGTFIFEGSNDNASFQTIPVYSQLVATGTPIIAAITPTSSNLGYVFPIQFRYIRVRIATTITGGSIQAVSRFSQAAYTPAFTEVSQATAANLATTATIASGTVTTVSTVTTLSNGQTAHSSAASGSPLRIGGRTQTTLDTTLADNDACNVMMTTAQQLVQKPFGTAENDWQYAAASGGISNTTTAVTIKTAGAASIRNYITGIQIMADALGAATELAIRDGAAGTVIWRTKIGTSGMNDATFDFATPLRGSAATLLEVVTLTASVTGSVYINVQGYQSF